MDELEILIANVIGAWRREVRHGREYVIVPMSLIVPGVLNGSAGPILYTGEVFQKNPSVWNGIPIVHTHPQVNGKYVSARNPDVLDQYGLGYVYNSLFQDKLASEGWFDVEAVKRVEPRIIDLITSNQKVELSTGLFTENEPATANATYNGTPYSYTVKGFQPDHVAILLDQKGACSVVQGCGVNVNQTSDKKTLWERLGQMLGIVTVVTTPDTNATSLPQANGDTQVNKTQLIQWLTLNCDCWKAPTDAVILETMNEDKLKQLKAAAEKVAQQQAVVNAVFQGAKDLLPAGRGVGSSGVAVTENIVPVATQASSTPVLTNEQLEDLEFARNEKNRQKAVLIQRIVCNLSDADKITQTGALAAKSLAQLQEIITFLPPVQTNNGQVNPALFYGAAGGTPQTVNVLTDDDVLEQPSWDREEAA